MKASITTKGSTALPCKNVSMINIAFGHVMRQLRTERKWSQLELEFRLHSSSKQISDVELGKKKVSLLYAKRVADVFGITLHELFDLIEQYIKETEV